MTTAECFISLKIVDSRGPCLRMNPIWIQKVLLAPQVDIRNLSEIRRIYDRLGRSIEVPPTAEIEALNRACYDHLASEYSSKSHQTCRNFDTANQILIREFGPQLRAWRNNRTTLSFLEIGVGTGALLPLLKREFSLHQDHIAVLDQSTAMLTACSDNTRGEVQEYHASSIYSSEPCIGSYDLIVGLLCDPYFTPDLFHRFGEILRPKGRVFITFPSYDWACATRAGSLIHANFHDEKERELQSFSFCWPRELINIMAARHAFSLTHWRDIPVGSIPNPSAINRSFRDKVGINAALLSGALFTRCDQ